MLIKVKKQMFLALNSLRPQILLTKSEIVKI